MATDAVVPRDERHEAAAQAFGTGTLPQLEKFDFRIESSLKGQNSALGVVATRIVKPRANLSSGKAITSGAAAIC